MKVTTVIVTVQQPRPFHNYSFPLCVAKSEQMANKVIRDYKRKMSKNERENKLTRTFCKYVDMQVIS